MKWKHIIPAIKLAAKIIDCLDGDSELLSDINTDNVVRQTVNAVYRDATRKPL